MAPFTFLIRGDSQIHIKNTVLRTLYYDNNEPMTSSPPYVPIVSGHPTYRIHYEYCDCNQGLRGPISHDRTRKISYFC